MNQILEAHDKVAEKTQILVPYNILPLDPDSVNQAIMRFPEVCILAHRLSNFRHFFSFALLFHIYCFNKISCFLHLQVQAAVYALRNTRGLPWPKDYKKKKDEDILDWLQAMFGFQVELFIFDTLLILTCYFLLILRLEESSFRLG